MRDLKKTERSKKKTEIKKKTREETNPCTTRVKRSIVFYPHNPVYVSRLDPSVLAFSLSLYRHPSICILFSSRFTSDNKQIRTPKITMLVFAWNEKRIHFLCWFRCRQLLGNKCRPSTIMELVPP